MLEWITGILVLLGSAFLLVAAVGVVRMPDLYMRMHSSTKAGTFGSVLVLIGLMVDFRELGVTSRAVAAIVFLFLTAPVAAHMIGRAGYLIGVELWKGTLVDGLKGKYDLEKGELKG